MSSLSPICALCAESIDDGNDSAEHILPNAMGGRRKVRGFLCKPCNDETGYSWDAVLAQQLQALCLLIGVSRERGDTPPMTIETTAGQNLRMTAKDGLTLTKPSYEAAQTEAGLEIRISARTMEEARQMLRGVKAKHPAMDIEATLAQADREWSQPEGFMRHRFQIGGYFAGCSIVKSALAFAIDTGLGLESCTESITFLRDPNDRTQPLGWYYATDVLTGRPAKTPVTCVGVHANPETGMVIGYVEYFGVHRAVVLLGRTYVGPEVRSVHGFDPRTAEALNLQIALPFDEGEVAAIFDYQRIPDGAQEAALAQILPEALKRQIDRERERVIGDAVVYALDRCGLKQGDVISPEYAQRISAYTSEYLAPWLALQIAKRRFSSIQPVQTSNER